VQYKIQVTELEVHFETGQTGGQQYSDTSPSSGPWLEYWL